MRDFIGGWTQPLKRGVPREAAEAFMARHAQIAMAIAFDTLLR